MKASEIVRNVVKEKLERNEVVASMTIRLVRGVEIARMAKTAGFDMIYIDLEHSTLTLEATGQICQAALSAGIGVHMGFHNHSGYIGGNIWDIAPVIDTLDPKWAGYYFDVRHAVVEGGDGGWRTAFSLAAPRLPMIALKDFYWEKAAAG